jgi:hypothetical protein
MARGPLSLDLFATADNAVVPRFFARFPEPLAEGRRAGPTESGPLSLPALWSCAPGVRVRAFPPRALLPVFVAKAKADGLRGIVIAPFTPSDGRLKHPRPSQSLSDTRTDA